MNDMSEKAGAPQKPDYYHGTGEPENTQSIKNTQKRIYHTEIRKS